MSLAQSLDSLEVLTLDLGGETFAVDAVSVEEILDLVPITDVPNARPFVNGLINVRGRIVPLADLRLKFGMEPTPPTIDTRIVVLETQVDGEPMTVGIRADKVHEVTELPQGALEETPKVGLRWREDYIRCVGKNGSAFIMVLDIAAMLSSGPRLNESGDEKQTTNQTHTPVS
jgi:purine-binding chemotaxis protein CheW